MTPEARTEYIVSCIREAGSMYPEDAKAFLAEHDAHRRSEALREAGGIADELIAAVLRTDPDAFPRVDSFRAYSDRLHEIADSGTPARKDTRDGTQPPAGESTQPAPDPTPLPVRWDRLVIHPGDTAGPDEPTIVCCIAADTGQPVALFLDEEHREALGLALIDPDGEMDQAPAEDFFQPGYAYTRPSHGRSVTFQVTHVSTAPDGSTVTAFGWHQVEGYDTWQAYSSEDFENGWTEATEGEVPNA